MYNAIYTIECHDTNSEDARTTDYYTSIMKVRNFVHLLVCAGYNEMFDTDSDSGMSNLSNTQDFRMQIYRKDGVYFSINKQFNGCTMKHLI